MHGTRSVLGAASPEATALWWAGLGQPGGVDESMRPCSLFRPTDPDQLFRAGGLVGRDGQVEVDRLEQMLQRLSLLMQARSIGIQDKANPGIPSGYTYLLQFIAHDMVDSVLSPQAAHAVLRSCARNNRARALVLDTLYGTGPDEFPSAYEYSATQSQITIDVPRTRLRVGAGVPLGAGRTGFCPMRDIARSFAPAGTPGEDRLCEALVADARNDAHTLVAQVTVLFQLLHNHVLGLLSWPPPQANRADDTFKRYLCARLIVTLIYRNIIAKDVLEKVLDGRVLARYRAEGYRPLLDGAKGVPVEFSHGAFRFGHAMVRASYQVASDQQLETSVALLLSAGTRPGDLPIKDIWLVDWARFFLVPGIEGADARIPNASLPLGPHYSPPLRDRNIFPPMNASAGTMGLAFRDLLSGCYAGTLSVPALCQKLQSVFGADLVPSFADWRPILRTWLSTVPATPALPEHLGTDEIDRLVDDPPLVFFVMLEAGESPMGAPDGERGRHLGPIGSIVVAETILGAMAANPVVETDGGSLRDSFIACAERLFPANRVDATAAVAGIDEIASMPDLLHYLQRNRVFAQRQPPAPPDTP